MKLEFHPDVCKQFQRLPRQVFPAVLNAVVGLAVDPRPSGVKKLVGAGNDWRIRVGEYRIVYEIDDQARTVTVFRIMHRRDAYR